MSNRILEASAVGVSGRITHPFDQIIPVQASLALPETGGFGNVRVEHYSVREVISFTAAYSVVAASHPAEGPIDLTASVTIEGLNILSMVTARRIVGRVAIVQDKDSGKLILTPRGSYFEELRIAGTVVDLVLDPKTTATGSASKVSGALFGPTEAMTELPSICDIVEDSASRRPSQISIPGFGRIRLGEFKYSDYSLQITMLEVELGSTPKGKLGIGGVKGATSDW